MEHLQRITSSTTCRQGLHDPSLSTEVSFRIYPRGYCTGMDPRLWTERFRAAEVGEDVGAVASTTAVGAFVLTFCAVGSPHGAHKGDYAGGVDVIARGAGASTGIIVVYRGGAMTGTDTNIGKEKYRRGSMRGVLCSLREFSHTLSCKRSSSEH